MMKIFYFFIFYFFLNIGILFSAKHDAIEWTVPPEGGYGKYTWREDGYIMSITGEFSPRQSYWWDATYELGRGTVFEGEIKLIETSNKKIWAPAIGFFTFKEHRGLKFFVENLDDTCTNIDCMYFTEITNQKDTFVVSIIGLDNALSEYYKSKSKLENERAIFAEKEKLEQEKRANEEKERIAREKKLEEEKQKKLINEQNSLVEVGSGSGFYVNNSGVVVTNYHVIEGCEEIRTGDDKLSLISFDILNDLALLNSKKSNTPFLKIRNDMLNQGEDVYVIGYPFGKDISTSSKITRGIITSLHGMANDYTKIQIDAPIQTGNSGGPVLDSKGRLIGVAVAKADTEFFIEQYGVIPDDVNFAVKASVLKTMMEANNITQQNIKIMDVSSGADVFKVANPSTLYLSCYIKYSDYQNLVNE